MGAAVDRRRERDQMRMRLEATKGSTKISSSGSWVKPSTKAGEHQGSGRGFNITALGSGKSFVADASFNGRFDNLVRGHWLDSIGNSIIVSKSKEQDVLTAVLSPLIDHPQARDRVFTIRFEKSKTWRCGNANLEWADESIQRLVWLTGDGRRSVWSRTANGWDGKDAILKDEGDSKSAAFPWLLNHATPEPWLPHDVPRDILYDGARVAALLDIRQLIGAKSEPQERLTHILMDHDLQPMRGDYLIPGLESPLWQRLPVPETTRRSIAQRISRIPHEALSQRVSWSGDSEVWVGHHKISCRARDIQVLESRWVLQPKDPQKPLEIARLLALYSVFDNPLSNRRSGVHLGLDPELRQLCDYELFASPLNAAVGNGRFASKWPHVEWRFGSIGSYPSVLSILPADSIVCVNPPFTDAYLEDVMARIAELKQRFRLRVAVPIQEASWRKKLQTSLPAAQLLRTYYDASAEHSTEVLHPTLLWEDPRCPKDRAAVVEDDAKTRPLQAAQGQAILVGIAAATALAGPAIAFYEFPRTGDLSADAAAVAATDDGQQEHNASSSSYPADAGFARGRDGSPSASVREGDCGAKGTDDSGSAAANGDGDGDEVAQLDASEWPALSATLSSRRGRRSQR